MKRGMAFLLCVLLALPAACAVSETADKVPEAVDLDLSVLSSTVVYAQVYNMMCDPGAYLGKMIRMAGLYNYYNDTEHGVVYHACIIQDATACCAQGIEFVREGAYRWPDEYPEIGTEILVTGELQMYEEGGTWYLHLVDSELTWDGV